MGQWVKRSRLGDYDITDMRIAFEFGASYREPEVSSLKAKIVELEAQNKEMRSCHNCKQKTKIQVFTKYDDIWTCELGFIEFCDTKWEIKKC